MWFVRAVSERKAIGDYLLHAVTFEGCKTASKRPCRAEDYLIVAPSTSIYLPRRRAFVFIVQFGYLAFLPAETELVAAISISIARSPCLSKGSSYLLVLSYLSMELP